MSVLRAISSLKVSTCSRSVPTCSPQWSRTIGSTRAPPRFFPPLPIALLSALPSRFFSLHPRDSASCCETEALSEKLEGSLSSGRGQGNPHRSSLARDTFQRRLSCWPGSSRATMYVKSRGRKSGHMRIAPSLMPICTRS